MGNYWSCVPSNTRASCFKDDGDFEIENSMHDLLKTSYTMTSFPLQLVKEEDPTIIFNRWYHGNIDRNEVRLKLMKSRKTRTYLVRKPITSQNCAYVLSVLLQIKNKTKSCVQHIKIYMSENKKFYCNTDFKANSVAEILDYYRDYLGEPCLKTSNLLKLNLHPFTYVTDKGEVQITRKLVHNITTNSTTVELGIENRKKRIT